MDHRSFGNHKLLGSSSFRSYPFEAPLVDGRGRRSDGVRGRCVWSLVCFGVFRVVWCLNFASGLVEMRLQNLWEIAWRIAAIRMDPQMLRSSSMM